MGRRVALLEGDRRQVVDEVAARLHGGQTRAAGLWEAATHLAKVSKSAWPRNKQEAAALLWTLLQWILDEDHYADAARLLWPPSMFTPEPDCTKRVWDALQASTSVLLMGAASQSKSFSPGVYFLLDWLRDPEFTTVKVVGPSENHLQDNLFSHLVELHRSASIPLPGMIGDLFIGLSLRARRSSISGVVVPLGRKAAGRLQGSKRFPRPVPHPIFGALSRLRVVLDEIENVPPGIWSDLDNVISNYDGQPEGLKIVGAFNPKIVGSEVYHRAEPPEGWERFDLEKHFNWQSKRGWAVVRLDAEKSENVREKRVVFPGLQTAEGLAKLRDAAGGPTGSSYLTFGRGAYPMSTTVETVIPAGSLTAVKATVHWIDRPRRVAGADVALEGGCQTVMATGQFGMANAVTYPPSLAYPQGQRTNFVDAQGRPTTRRILVLDGLHVVPPGKTLQTASALRKMAVEAGVEPSWLCLDRTGNAAGVHDLIRDLWSPDVRGVNGSEAASEIKVFEEDAQTPHEMYAYACTELWFALKRWIEFDMFKIDAGVDTSVLYAQLSGRRYEESLRRVKVESKHDYKKRQMYQESPDLADAVTLLLHAVRMAMGVPVSAIHSHGSPEALDVPVNLPCDITNQCEYDAM